MQVAETTGFFEVHHATGARNANCVSFATPDFVKDDVDSIAMGPEGLIESILRGFPGSGVPSRRDLNAVIIDYSNVDEPTIPSGAAPARQTGANIILLSADPALIELLRDSLAGNHRVWRADDSIHAADLMVTAGNAVLLVDCSLADQDTHKLVTQIHQQFPDLPIIVAGRREDEAGLAELISQGVIFRFLHKPASAERIRNFVEATQRRKQPGADLPAARPRAVLAPVARISQIARPWSRIDRGMVRRWARRSLLLIPLAGIIWLVAAWKPWEYFAHLSPDRNVTAIAPVDAGQDPKVLKLLDAAGIALTQGRLTYPPERNALELYRAALADDPGNRMAQRGIDLVADELLAAAERALNDQDLPRLASAIDAARSARPDHPRLQFFTTQIARERERQAQARQPLRATNVAVGQALDSSSTRTAAGRVQGLVLLANERMRSNQLVGDNDSAHAYLLAAQRIDPADPGVQQGVTALATLLVRNTRDAIREGRLEDAGTWVHNAVALDVDRIEVAELRSELEVARLGSVREDRARLLLLANQRIAQGRLVEPTGDSARHYLDLLRASDPSYEGLPETSALLATRSLEEARRLVASGDADGAEEVLRAASGAGATRADVSALAGQIAAARSATPRAGSAPVVLPENALHRIRFVPPQYPARALERSITGWVDIEFTVATDGTTRDATVRAAEPEKVFDQAALDAVRGWRYEPYQVNGATVDQRVAARLRFELAH